MLIDDFANYYLLYRLQIYMKPARIRTVYVCTKLVLEKKKKLMWMRFYFYEIFVCANIKLNEFKIIIFAVDKFMCNCATLLWS